MRNSSVSRTLHRRTIENMSALRKRATPEEIEEAEGEALLAGYDEWVTRGRPGAKSHEEFMAEILGGAR